MREILRKMNWNDAICHAVDRGVYVVPFKMLLDCNMPFEHWTSTTDPDNVYNAFTNRGRSAPKTERLFSILVDNVPVMNGISHQHGDTKQKPQTK